METRMTSPYKLLVHCLTIAFLLAACSSGRTAEEDTYTPDQDDHIVLPEVKRKLANGDDVTILFIGNSMTAASGGQFQIVPKLLESRGWKVFSASQIHAGETLEEHWLRNQGKVSKRRIEWAKTKGGETLDKLIQGHEKNKGQFEKLIRSQKWDYVVLQPWLCKNIPHKYAELIIGMIRETSPKTEVIMYMTWSTCEECIAEAKENKVKVAPTGLAKNICNEKHPEIFLHRKEGDFHPGQTGAYMIGCTIYSTITGKTPTGLPSKFVMKTTYDFGKFREGEKEAVFSLDPEIASKIQKVAWEARDYITDCVSHE